MKKNNNPPSSMTCPCGTSFSYDLCCGPYHTTQKLPETALALMRSRYSAFALQLVDYLVKTTHPSKVKPALRKSLVSAVSQTRWTNLRILQTAAGTDSDKVGKVLFEASYVEEGDPYHMTEHSRFRKLAGRWYYLDDRG